MERIYHTWDKWECYPAGFYETKPPQKDMTIDDCKQAYADFLRDENALPMPLCRCCRNGQIAASII